MNARTIDDQLDKYLADAHSIEEQALTQLRRAPDIAGDERLAAVFERHLAETNAHEDRFVAGSRPGAPILRRSRTSPAKPAAWEWSRSRRRIRTPPGS